MNKELQTKINKYCFDKIYENKERKEGKLGNTFEFYLTDLYTEFADYPTSEIDECMRVFMYSWESSGNPALSGVTEIQCVVESAKEEQDREGSIRFEEYKKKKGYDWLINPSNKKEDK